MKGTLFLNGEPPKNPIPVGVKVCCDGAYSYLKKLNISPDVILGDFDSLKKVVEGAIVYPKEKDLTDGEIGVDYLIEKGCDEIVIYGGGGKREDHFLGNLHLLLKCLFKGVKAKMITEYAELFVCNGKARFDAIVGQTISLVPFYGLVHIINGSGLKYPVINVDLPYGSTLGISNVAKANTVEFEVDSGVLLVCKVIKE